MIKSEINKIGLFEKPYPKLMVGKVSKTIVLFKQARLGTVVSTSDANPIGYNCSTWDMDYFYDLIGTVTLSNE